MSASWSVSPLRLGLRHVFRIAHGASTERTNALVTMQLPDGQTCFGEAALPPYYPWTLADIESYVAALSFDELDINAPSSFLDTLPDGPGPARAAIDMAVHDAWGRALGHPLYRVLGLDPARSVASSYAMPIPETLEEHADRVKEVAHFPFLKLKIGSGDVAFDEAVIRTTRDHYKGALCIDVNAGWSIPDAVRIIPRLDDCNLAFIEQPIAAKPVDDWHLLRRMLPGLAVPLIADESVQGSDTVIALAGAADGINVKLAKCGGIRAAMHMVSLARGLDLSLMLGCMIESSVALTAAAHIGPLFDYLDLDGPMHLAADPFNGLTFDAGVIGLPDRPGLGVIPTGT